MNLTLINGIAASIIFLLAMIAFVLYINDISVADRVQIMVMSAIFLLITAKYA